MAIGHHLVGVAVDTQPLLDALVAHVGPPPPDRLTAPRSLALVSPGPDPESGPARTHYGLWEASQEVVRCRTPERLVRATVAWLEPWAGPRPDGLVGLRCSVAVNEQGQAVLLPNELRGWWHPLGARLRRHGLRLVDSPLVDLDPDTGDVIVGGSALLASGVLPTADEAVPAARYPVAHIVMIEDAPRRVEMVAALARAVVPGSSPTTVLGVLVGLVSRAATHRVGGGIADEAVAVLALSLKSAVAG